MNDLLSKISSYNILNYLLPGTLFAVVVTEMTQYSFIQDDLFLAIFFYYFVGLVISRLGSLLLEPLLQWCGFLKYSDYPEYVRACIEDEKIDTLSETNNMFRTLLSLFICVLLMLGFEQLADAWPGFREWLPMLGVVGLVVLFAFSWRKQSGYINVRVAVTKEEGS